jgi:sugar/nucleoside kinase (ribokinase family)
MIDGKTATVIDLIDHTGEHTMISCRGAASSEPYGKIETSLFKKDDILHVSVMPFNRSIQERPRSI